ncbi:hypothetical protein O181_008464 [Austropuccinia psidii MF-1]|uniref:Uncharacterized protein n=1 Tax=Austropuccinia psidii MF-1 TaxID=1389203 RepID=A0A9Q3BMM1_9BASI|nr:hypothetical protein [Austropuccinia psidii MF-1]
MGWLSRNLKASTRRHKYHPNNHWPDHPEKTRGNSPPTLHHHNSTHNWIRSTRIDDPCELSPPSSHTQITNYSNGGTMEGKPSPTPLKGHLKSTTTIF